MKLLALTIFDLLVPLGQGIISVSAYTNARKAYTSLFNGWTQEAEMDCDGITDEEERSDLTASYDQNKRALAAFMLEHGDFFDGNTDNDWAVWWCENEDLRYRFSWMELDKTT